MRARACAAFLCGLVIAVAASAVDRGAELERLREAIRDARERVATYERQQRGLLEAVEALDRSLVLLRREVASAQTRAREARAELVAVEAEAGDLTAKLDRTRRAMSARAVALYKAGEVGAVRLLFSAGDLREFLSRVQALRLLLSHDVLLIERHRAQSVALTEARDRASVAATRRDEAFANLSTREGELSRERRAKEKVVSRLHEDRARERAALRELETAARALEETLASLGESSAPEVVVGWDFASLRRRLPSPVDAPVVQGFGRVVDSEFRTATLRNGIALGAKSGEPVRAVAPAAVRFADWFRGYGRLVILDHGDQYFTVSGHLDEVEVEVGDSVEAGEVIGSVGDTGSLAGPRLYFEIRQGGQALDPGEWLASGD